MKGWWRARHHPSFCKSLQTTPLPHNNEEWRFLSKQSFYGKNILRKNLLTPPIPRSPEPLPFHPYWTTYSTLIALFIPTLLDSSFQPHWTLHLPLSIFPPFHPKTALRRLFDHLYGWFFKNLQFDNYTLDFDSTVEQRCGEQEGTAKGYNPKRPGRQSHHPLLAFVADLRMIANFWLRPGNTSASTNFLSFLDDTLHKLEGKKVGLIRMDSGFFSNQIMSYLEDKSLHYIK